MNTKTGLFSKFVGRGSAIWSRLVLALFALVPTVAFAAGAESKVKLNFTQSDKNYLYISLGLALLAIVTGFAIRSKVLAQSPGDEKMQEVGAAIKDGAMAYLRQQFRTMSIFVALLSVGLFFYYNNEFGNLSVLGLSLAWWLPICFILGVLASYVAGYVGMDMAVASNMRVAAAAQTSYKRALETGFRAGAVAGLITVGMGLLGATIIFLVAGEQAMKLLIGFGFGGSLAALFMRVGGGIYTKAADVGADLVGKVEAGIPEDDPRNAATIADNVGDNVGDCAGMAADVFESYEVTLVAAIVLGAATAAVFDQSTWMKLILFALMARGVGIVASILGIFFVKGKDDEKMDPLQPISRGFWFSAAVAAVGTAALAYVMMQDIVATSYVDAKGVKVSGLRKFSLDDLRGMYAINNVEQGITKPGETKPATAPAKMDDATLATKSNEFLTKMYEEANKNRPTTSPALAKPDVITPEMAKEYRDDPLRNYTIVTSGFPSSSLTDIGRGFEEDFYVVKMKFSQPGQPTPPTPRWQFMAGSQLATSMPNVEIIDKIKAGFAVSSINGDIDWVVSTMPKEKKEATQLYAALPSFSYVQRKVDMPVGGMSQDPVIEDGSVGKVIQSQKAVDWWRFFLAIFFGILMA
jgi:K(+)-stimulated pyrophosphate-energized sodium pump